MLYKIKSLFKKTPVSTTGQINLSITNQHNLQYFLPFNGRHMYVGNSSQTFFSITKTEHKKIAFYIKFMNFRLFR